MTKENYASGICEDEIVLLLKHNSPILLKTAKLHLPLFFTNLHDFHPKLVRSELTFCIYLKFNFTTKEISKFLNVTPKAIQNRKNRIRKKLSIPSDVDLYKWLNYI